MKKKCLILLTGLLLLSFTACSNTPSESSTNTVNTENTQESSQMQTEDSANESTQGDADTKTQGEEQNVPMEDTYLKDLYSSHNMKVGTCITGSMIDNATQKNLILEQFSSITMENAMKPDYIFNKQESIKTGNLVVEFNRECIKILDFAKENNLAMRGHTLVWYSQTPSWIFYEDFDTSKSLVSREVMLERMDSYMQQVFALLTEGGYADLFYAYDVVNEAWMEDGTMRENNWKTIIGDDYLWQAFYYANKYAPEHIDLYYNDYNEQFKTQTLIDFVQSLVDENGNSLIDGIGLQAHLYTQDNLNTYFKMIDALAATGLKLQVTELDVSLGAWQKNLPANEDNLKIQGRFYYDLIHGLFERADAGQISMDSITFWGFYDKLSWRKAASPLLYDNLGNPKFSYYGAMQMKDFAGFN